MGKGADLIDIAKLFLYIQPSLLLLSVPMAMLIAIFLTYGRMGTDNEIVVMKASGMSFLGISRPAIILSTACFVLLLFVSLYLLPRGTQSFKYTLHETIVKKASLTFEEGSFSDVFKDTVIYVKEMYSKDRFRGIFVYQEANDSLKEPVAIVAENGEMISNVEEGLVTIRMNNGLIHTFTDGSSTEITFSKYDFLLTTGVESMAQAKPDEVKTMDLLKKYNESVSLAVELQRRLALPFACLIFGMLGPALSNKIGKIGRLGGFSLSLLILIVYYMLMIMGEGLSKSGKLSPFLGGWIPNMLFGFIAMVLFYYTYKDKPIKRA
jgi:lipopolysaccharide export system permease protein